MNKVELLNNTEFKKADGSLPIIYITSDDDVVKNRRHYQCTYGWKNLF